MAKALSSPDRQNEEGEKKGGERGGYAGADAHTVTAEAVCAKEDPVDPKLVNLA